MAGTSRPPGPPGRPPGRSPGIREVARAAGVSPTTVSHVYNRKGEVSAATRERVLRIGEELGYRPNAIGQALRSGRSRVLGIVVSYRETAIWAETYMPYFRHVIAGAAMAAVEHGYSIAAAPALPDGTIDTTLPLDGVIVVDPVAPDPIVEQCLQRDLAVVTDGGYRAAGPTERLRSVRPDLASALPGLLDHLTSEAHRPAGPALFVGPRLDAYSTETIEEYRRWCRARGVPEVVWALPSGRDPVTVAHALLADRPAGLGAVHCLNETYANAVLASADAHRIDVPGSLQVSLVGKADAATADRRAAYLDVDPAETGARCVDTLIALLAGEEPPDLTFAAPLVPARER